MTFDEWLQVEINSDELAEQMVIPLETVFNAATEAERERCCDAVRRACGPCQGTGTQEHPVGEWSECEYCGRLIGAIREEAD